MEDVLQKIERESRASTARVLDILHDMGRPDLAGELERNLRDVRSGVSSARNIWHSISPAQRRALVAFAAGATTCPLRTARPLCARDLLACDGGLLDPEARFALTEHGRFVLAHGPRHS